MTGLPVAIIGCGRIAGGYNQADETAVLTHVLAWRAAGATIVACIDRDAAAAARFATRWAIPVHGTDLAAVLADTGPFVVSDCTPPEARASVAETLARSPSVVAVLAEKPLGRSGAEAARVAEVYAQADTGLAVNLHRAFDPCYRAVDDVVRRGELGQVQHLSAYAYGPLDVNMVHWLERAIALMGPAEDAWALPAGDGLQVRFAGGGVGLFVATAPDGPDYIDLHLVGTAGRLSVDDAERRVRRWRICETAFGGHRVRVPAEEPWTGPLPDWSALRHVVGDMAVRAQSGDRSPHPVVARAVAAARLLDPVASSGGGVAGGTEGT